MKLVAFLWLAGVVHCARVLVVLPTTFYSHQLVMKLLYKELSLRGHQVVAITTSPLDDPTLVNLTEIDVSYLNRYHHNISFAKLSAERSKYLNIFRFFRGLGNAAEEIFADSRVQKLLNDENERFDLVITEYCTHPAFAAFSYRFKSPLVGYRTMELRPECHNVVGNPVNPSYIPTGCMDFKAGFWGRLDNFITYLAQMILRRLLVVPKAHNILQKHMSNFSEDVEEIERNYSIVMTNTHPLLNGVRPVVPTYIQVPGIHINRSIFRASEELLRFLNEAKQGVIYLNFGSVVHSIDLEGKQLRVILKALGRLPYKVLWKFNVDKIAGLPNNFKIFKWVPQETVLSHGNVKLFLTHGGMLSYQEAVHYKVPLIGFPFFGDQFVNVNRMVELKIGKRLDYYQLDEAVLVSTISEVIENKAYKERITKISNMIEESEILLPMEKAVWWIEYVLRYNGTPYLKSKAAELNLYEYLLVDVILFLVLIAAVIATLVYRCISKVIDFSRRTVNKEKRL